MRRRERPAPPPDDLTDEQAAALERAASPPGWRMDGPEFAEYAPRAVEQLLAARWRRRIERATAPGPSGH